MSSTATDGCPVVLKMNISADGIVGRGEEQTSWLAPSMSDDVVSWLEALLSGAGTHVMGRVAYEEMAGHWPDSDDPLAAPMNEIPKVVFSSTLKDPEWGPTRVATRPVAAEIEALKSESGSYILVHGGTRLAHSLVAADLIDEYHYVYHPVVLGSGDSMFPATQMRHLELIATASFDGGCVVHTYRRHQMEAACPLT